VTFPPQLAGKPLGIGHFFYPLKLRMRVCPFHAPNSGGHRPTPNAGPSADFFRIDYQPPTRSMRVYFSARRIREESFMRQPVGLWVIFDVHVHCGKFTLSYFIAPIVLRPSNSSSLVGPSSLRMHGALKRALLIEMRKRRRPGAIVNQWSPPL